MEELEAGGWRLEAGGWRLEAGGLERRRATDSDRWGAPIDAIMG